MGNKKSQERPLGFFVSFVAPSKKFLEPIGGGAEGMGKFRKRKTARLVAGRRSVG
jgi:hypothetical protein